jgi:hypothetical protein
MRSTIFSDLRGRVDVAIVSVRHGRRGPAGRRESHSSSTPDLP